MPDFLRRLIDEWQKRRQARQTGEAGPSFLHRHRKALTVSATMAAALLLIVGGVFLSFYRSYARMIDQRLGSGSLRTSSVIYAAPRLLVAGDQMTAPELIGRLQRAGYTEKTDNRMGHYRLLGDAVEITSGPESYFQPHTVLVRMADGKVAAIESETDKKRTDRYWVEPELITNVLDESRGKRIPVAYSEFPRHMVQAIVSVEDKRFFQHSGLDLLRVAKAAYVDIKEGRKEQGASTLTMQLARSFWLDQDKNWRRKVQEIMIAAELERRFTKEEILQLYANEVYLGRRGSFSIHGFGEAAHAYFSKDVRDLSVPEAAMLAGIIQRPSYYNPFRYPERVKERRDLVLTLMHSNGYLTPAQLQAAQATPITLKPLESESSEAPYFVDMVNNELQDQFQDWNFADNAYRIYSTLDLDLQNAAGEAIRTGMAPLFKKFSNKKKVKQNLPQVALICLDPHTGAIKALIGGRNYAESQLNRVFAKRQPGSTFKPFVYASALEMTARGKGANVTAGSTFMDEPTTFSFNNQTYQPANFGDRYMGTVTVRKALTNSLNIPTIKVAQAVGFQPVVDTARAAGITAPLQATPSLALGSYEVPPIELAEAYTIFSNEGRHAKRFWVNAIRDGANKLVYSNKPVTNQAISEQVSYIITNIMEDVVNKGTAASVRGRGFKAPAAGKTGTARDGWFAGFTSELLTVVWVGFDDYSDLDMEGSKSALPVWTEFMKRAHSLPQYSKPKPFKEPAGVVKARIDTSTGLLAGPSCINIATEYFAAGTQPKKTCNSDHYEDMFGTPPTETVLYEAPRRTVLGRIKDIFR